MTLQLPIHVKDKKERTDGQIHTRRKRDKKEKKRRKKRIRVRKSELRAT